MELFQRISMSVFLSACVLFIGYGIIWDEMWVTWCALLLGLILIMGIDADLREP